LNLNNLGFISFEKIRLRLLYLELGLLLDLGVKVWLLSLDVWSGLDEYKAKL